MGKRAAVICGLGTYTPERVLTNQDLTKMMETSEQWIASRTGIMERRIAGADEFTSTMAVKAAERALADAGREGRDLDMIIVATNTSDTIFPSTAARVQAAISPKPVSAVDIQAGCTGWVYAVEMGRALVVSGTCERVLIIGADKLSSLVDYQDRSTAILFGDGAGAIVLENRDDSTRGVWVSELKADGRGADLLSVPGGGSNFPATMETVANRLHYLKMNGSEVFRFAIQAMPEAVTGSLAKAGLDIGQVDWLIPHQANIRIIDSAVKKMGLNPERVIINIERYGNTSVASIPIALAEARDDGRIIADQILVWVAFGAGLTWGANVVCWGS